MRFDNTVFEFAASWVEQLPSDNLPEVAFSGRSNTRESSLISRLVNREALARASTTPGKTGTINFYGLVDCRLMDLPDYGYIKVSQSEELRWANLVEGYFSTGRRIGLVVQIVDVCHEPTVDDLHMIDFLSADGFPFVVVMTESDKLNKGERTTQIQLYDDLSQNREQVRRLPFSPTSGEGLDTLREWITTACAVQE